MTPSQSTDDLVKRLRGNPSRGFNAATRLFDEAADTIERLQADLAARDKTIETLVGVADRVLVKYGNDWTEWRDLQDAIEAARSEGGEP